MKIFVIEVAGFKGFSLSKYLKRQNEDLAKTYASVKELSKVINHKKRTSIKTGILNFVGWYKLFYKI